MGNNKTSSYKDKPRGVHTVSTELIKLNTIHDPNKPVNTKKKLPVQD